MASQDRLACGSSAIVRLCECVQCSGMCLNYGGGKLYGSQVAAIRLYTRIPLLFSVCVLVCVRVHVFGQCGYEILLAAQSTAEL